MKIIGEEYKRHKRRFFVFKRDMISGLLLENLKTAGEKNKTRKDVIILCVVLYTAIY